jgi:hypothetical protein
VKEEFDDDVADDAFDGVKDEKLETKDSCPTDRGVSGDSTDVDDDDEEAQLVSTVGEVIEDGIRFRGPRPVVAVDDLVMWLKRRDDGVDGACGGSAFASQEEEHEEDDADEELVLGLLRAGVQGAAEAEDASSRSWMSAPAAQQSSLVVKEEEITIIPQQHKEGC